jgi:hypothetical protein
MAGRVEQDPPLPFAGLLRGLPRPEPQRLGFGGVPIGDREVEVHVLGVAPSGQIGGR